MTIEEYFGDWCRVIDIKEAEYKARLLASSPVSVCPMPRDMYRAFELCSLEKLRVVILGQDPYPDYIDGKPRATGIAFANSPDIPEAKISPSLEILRESVIDFTIPHGIVNFDQSLEEWERQGVLLLNTALSCEKGIIGSHISLWKYFIKSFLTNLSRQTTGIVYILMGSQAQSFEPFIDKSSNHIIRIRHPSYYARTHTRMPSDIWNEVNDILLKQNGCKIEWYKEY